MKFLGFDISSSCTGWALIEAFEGPETEKKYFEKRLVEYGQIKPDPKMGTTQRLYYFGNEIKKVIERQQPDEIQIEEIIFASGVKTLRVLASFRGVALFQAYGYQKREVSAFEPPRWKKDLNIKGNAKKCEIQLEICKRFNLLDEEKIKKYHETIDSYHQQIELLKPPKKIKRKKGEVVEEKPVESKAEIKKKIKAFDKLFDQVSININSDCGISADIADAIGVTLTGINEFEKHKI